MIRLTPQQSAVLARMADDADTSAFRADAADLQRMAAQGLIEPFDYGNGHIAYRITSHGRAMAAENTEQPQ